MRERATELKAAAGQVEGEQAVLAKIAAMPGPDRALGKRLHAIITDTAPALSPRLWYGMPAYAKAGPSSASSRTRTSSRRGMRPSDSATRRTLDEGAMWPIAFALTQVTAADEARIRAMVKRAMS